ncbi:hypothetical protein J437_LFUL011357 [Ladona fulva]|uniref:XK-related protein n=1 Tax=Ladona fulva TaxID=123851 RepID=A0A8K0P3A4_LADFU|nr:hypothetical protein J437_LFUL011357 [Ladona fulva]
MCGIVTKGTFEKAFSLFLLVLSFVLYISDVVSDLVVAGDHYSHGNSHYGTLTLVFVFAPYIAETLSKLILKALGWDKEYGKLKWKDVFSFNDFKILKWMGSSFRYAVNTWKDYQPIAPCYAELHAYRCRKGKLECKTVAPVKEADSAFIHTVYNSMLAWNERYTLQTKLAESLSEAAPQLLLQLFIVIRQFMAGDDVGFRDVDEKFSSAIAQALLSLYPPILANLVPQPPEAPELPRPLTSHERQTDEDTGRHYVEGGRVLNNPYTWSGRILEFIGNVFVYGSRLTAICLVTTMLGAAFVGGFFIYLAIIYFLMITISARKEIYKTLHRYKTTIFWPLHRMFTVPYRIGIWRMDSVDHLLFYLEIICMAISLPFTMPAEVDYKVAWIIAGCVLVCQAIGMSLLCSFKKFLHPYGYVCENR